MSDGIERLVEARARALCRVYRRDEEVWQAYLAIARAMTDADAALGLAPETLAGLISGRLVAVPREPSEAMLTAPLYRQPDAPARLESRTDLRPLIWRAMVGAAAENGNG